MTQPPIDYALLGKQLHALLDTRDWLTNSAQLSAFVFEQIPELNWVGFYLQREPEMLCLGPFQGKTACHPIPFNKGVCGAAARSGQTQRVDDVHDVADHIACDTNSRSELVIPIMSDGTLWGVFDLDSPQPTRFSTADQVGLESLVAIFTQRTELPRFC
ncbi:GAF domain-containing protein [Halomonas llamarensis]|uniref:GAF domain-containing protein n=1 Tax=Halomonas llamarensis TaxID=2945104 RepID=A0ABT0SMR5_9GAMM|nr:GAF domain-containing protein [Halomonas llamarensis]MCL7929093.1 GAF domain-containing protein [Halomonas llamarensis]